MKFVLVFILFFPLVASAHPGNTDRNGGHTCKTNCVKWGYEYGEYHRHNTKLSKGTQAVTKKNITTLKKTFVQPHYKKDGTYIQGYWRN